MDNLQKSFQGKQFVGSCDGINLHQENWPLHQWVTDIT
jgi:hypothetical protein